jgi:4-hydroxy-3-polyprenylbenzoate decarboxylase
LRELPVELVKCETNDLLVPASAEIVIEGKISSNPETFVMEGPFGEYTGYYGGLRSLKPAIRVECITHRRDPILTGIHVGATPGCPSDNAHWMGASWSAAVWVALEELGIPGVTDIWFGHWPEVMKVQIKKSYQGQAKHVASAIWGTRAANYGAKILIVVDEEIDIRDHDAIEWALAYRLNPAMGGVTLYEGTIGSLLDPSVPHERRDPVKYGQGVWTRLLLDATINWELEPRAEYGGKRYPPLATDLSPAMRALVRERWEEYGFHGIQ